VGGQEEECTKARKDEVGMDIVGDQEDSTPILGNIGNQIEKVSLEDENDTPQMKETCLEVSRTIPESLVP